MKDKIGSEQVKGRIQVELKKFEGIEKGELAMVNVAYAFLEQKTEVIEFNDLLSQISNYLELNDSEIEEQMVQFYTDLNIDGRFISLGENRWGLREWYPVDSIDEELTHDNDLEDLKPKLDPEGFDDYSDIEKYSEETEAAEDEKENDDEIEYGDRVEVDEHGVMVEDEDEEDLGEFKDEIEDLGGDLEENLEENEEELEGLSVVEDEDMFEDEEENDGDEEK